MGLLAGLFAGFTPVAGFASALLMAILLAAGASLAGALWARELHRRAQRRANRILHALSESVTSAGSPAEIAEGLAEQLPSVSEATSVRLYLYNHATNSLEFVPTREEPDPMAIAVDAPQDGLANGVVKCFLSRSAVHVPDVRRNPLVSAGWRPGVARSAMFVPLLAQQDRVGVLEVASVKRLGYFSREDQAAVQHLSNQVASALKLREQRAVREQLFRSEKLAATAQLITGVAGELSEPLDRILELAESAAAVSLGAHPSAPNPDAPAQIRQIAAESRRASDILARLISFAHPDSASARAVDVNALVTGLVQFREPEWKARGLRVQNRLAPEAALAVGARGQLEQLFLNLLVHAEQCAAAAAAKTLSLASSRMGGRIVVEIHYSSDTPRESLAESASDAAGTNVFLDVCRGIAATHGGEIRVVSRSSSAGFDVDLPLVADADAEAGGAPPVPRKSTRVLTLLLVDSDAAAQRQLLGMLAARGHRVIPAPAEQAADLAPRVRFDAVFWAVRSGGGSRWSDQQDRIRPAVPAFVLVSDGYDRDLASSLEDSGGFLLSRPVEDRDLDRVLESVEARTAVRAPA